MRHDRIVLGYHGCDADVAERLLAGEPFHKSQNDYDWPGTGVYFWEYGADRALRFARDQQRRGKLREPTVVGSLIQLGHCFDLMDTSFTRTLGGAYRLFRSLALEGATTLPRNAGSTPDKKLRRLDCSVLNFYFDWQLRCGIAFDTVRGGFIQIAVRNPACILGVFRPTLRP